MQENPAQDWQWLTQHYREIGDEELEELAEDFADLTETAQQVLRNELKNRGLGEPGSKAEAPTRPESSVPWQIAGAVDPDGGLADSGASPGEEDDDSPQVFTWKTPLCECETTDQANQIQAMLKRAGIESWVESRARAGPLSTLGLWSLPISLSKHRKLLHGRFLKRSSTNPKRRCRTSKHPFARIAAPRIRCLRARSRSIPGFARHAGSSGPSR